MFVPSSFPRRRKPRRKTAHQSPNPSTSSVFPSPPRRRGAREAGFTSFVWIPAFAGMTNGSLLLEGVQLESLESRRPITSKAPHRTGANAERTQKDVPQRHPARPAEPSREQRKRQQKSLPKSVFRLRQHSERLEQPVVRCRYAYSCKDNPDSTLAVGSPVTGVGRSGARVGRGVHAGQSAPNANGHGKPCVRPT